MSKIEIIYPFVDQSIKDLFYCLFPDKADKKVLKVINTLHVSTDFFDLEAVIIGQSHYLTFSFEKGIMTELMACVDSYPDVLLGARGKEIEQSPATLDFYDHHYTFHANIFELNEGPSGELEAFDLFYDHCKMKNSAIEYLFETPGSYAYEAKTAIAAHVSTDNSFEIQTLHLYPNEACGIITHTSLRKI